MHEWTRSISRLCQTVQATDIKAEKTRKQQIFGDVDVTWNVMQQQYELCIGLGRPGRPHMLLDSQLSQPTACVRTKVPQVLKLSKPLCALPVFRSLFFSGSIHLNLVFAYKHILGLPVHLAAVHLGCGTGAPDKMYGRCSMPWHLSPDPIAPGDPEVDVADVGFARDGVRGGPLHRHRQRRRGAADPPGLYGATGWEGR